MNSVTLAAEEKLGCLFERLGLCPSL